MGGYATSLPEPGGVVSQSLTNEPEDGSVSDSQSLTARGLRPRPRPGRGEGEDGEGEGASEFRILSTAAVVWLPGTWVGSGLGGCRTVGCYLHEALGPEEGPLLPGDLQGGK